MADKTYGDLVWKISYLEEENSKLLSDRDKLEKEIGKLKKELPLLKTDSQFLKLVEFYSYTVRYSEDSITHWFDCPCCGHRAVVIKSPLGMWARCSGCGLEIQV